MSKNLARRQLQATRRDMERDLKRRDREKLVALRASIKAARAAKRGKLQAVTGQCAAARKALTLRAQKARERLRASIKRTRERARGMCSANKGSTLAATLREIEKAVGALEQERSVQRSLAVWTRPTSCAVPRGGKARERREESDCEVAGNIDDPGLRIVWQSVKKKIHATARKSRTEAFLEWAAEHQADVYRIQEADAERALVALEQEERKLGRDLKKAGRYQRHTPAELAELLAGVPF